MRRHTKWIATGLMAFLGICSAGGADAPKPLMKDFIGINGHFNFRPELYRQIGGLVRNYHPMHWDVEGPGAPITFPMCINGVNWKEHVYGKWVESGFEVDLCVQFGNFGGTNENYIELWEGQEDWFHDYGYEMAKYFGPSGDHALVTSIEVGNEPGTDFDDPLYQKLFTQIATGIRKADPEIQIVTATAHAGPADKYHKSLDEAFSSEEIKSLYDVINLHVYAIKPEGDREHPWERSYPEDPSIDYLKNVDAAIAWRDENAPDKKVWITEFGYDAATSEAMEKREGWAKELNWTGVTDLQQAQYLVRSLFTFAERDIGRAYIYYYNDDDKASVHAASGLTRDFEPKPSFWALKHLYETLGEYRLNSVVLQQEGDRYVYEFTSDNSDKPAVWAAWSPTGNDRKVEVILQDLPGNLVHAECMPTQEGPAPKASWEQMETGAVRLLIKESPVYLIFETGK